jgi:hypothetical protein
MSIIANERYRQDFVRKVEAGAILIASGDQDRIVKGKSNS